MHKIQQALKAPKGQTNSFGGYQYRSCEDIVEAVKPILFERGYYLNLTDKMIILGDRVYVEATASVWEQGEGSEPRLIAKAVGSAREAPVKKGMDDSQITGAASSYARKYALNGLFAIDDTKDADTDEYTKKAKRGETITKKSKAIKTEDKEWYNDFDDHKEAMVAKMKSGESTADTIIANLRAAFKVSKETAEKIRALTPIG